MCVPLPLAQVSQELQKLERNSFAVATASRVTVAVDQVSIKGPKQALIEISDLRTATLCPFCQMSGGGNEPFDRIG